MLLRSPGLTSGQSLSTPLPSLSGCLYESQRPHLWVGWIAVLPLPSRSVPISTCQKALRHPPLRACSVLWPSLNYRTGSNLPTESASSAQVPLNRAARLPGNSEAGGRAALQRLCLEPAKPGLGGQHGPWGCRLPAVMNFGKRGQDSLDLTHASRYVCRRESLGCHWTPHFSPGLGSRGRGAEEDPAAEFVSL